jgi:hypothetical protein
MTDKEAAISQDVGDVGFARADAISQDVDDVGSEEELLRYALGAQLELLIENRDHLSKNKIAYAAGLGNSHKSAGTNLSHLLAGRNSLTVPQLQKLDRAISASAPAEESTGGLASLAVRLSGKQRNPAILFADVPPAWGHQMLQGSADTETAVLTHASALLSDFRVASKLDKQRGVEDVSKEHSVRLKELVLQLIRIAVGPPTLRNIDAQLLLGSLASYTVNSTLDPLEHELRTGPMGFRVWRVITKLVKLSGDEGPYSQKLQNWVRRLVNEANVLRDDSIYPGRSLDLELAITVPSAWRDADDWVGKALLARALNDKATIRERGTAAIGLWQRVIVNEGRDRDTFEPDLRQLIDDFRKGAVRPDAVNGIRWVADTLEDVIENNLAVCNDWPTKHAPWMDRIRQAASELDHGIPAHLVTGTKRLFTHALLQNAGVYRRQAIETLVTGGWVEPVTRAMGSLLDLEEEETWLRIRAEFALGYMQNRRQHVENSLKKACQIAYRNLTKVEDEPTRAQVTEMHATLFAIGDCFGAPGAEGRAHSAREGIRDILYDIVMSKITEPKSMHLIARAATYILTVTAQPQRNGQKDLSQELLEQLRKHPDEITRNFSSRALDSRFDKEGGGVRPLLNVDLS